MRQGQAPVADVRALPVPVRTVPGETVTCYLARLAEANTLTERDLRLHVTDIAGLSPFRPTWRMRDRGQSASGRYP